MIKTTGKEKNYDVSREYTEVLQKLNINGRLDNPILIGEIALPEVIMS